jgi:hypothetical protein
MEQEEKRSLEKDYAEATLKKWASTNWRSWGSWFSWGSPVGLGLFIISIGIFILLLHYSGIV